MNLTTRQQKIYDNVLKVDSDWDKNSFIETWNAIINLNKFISITKGKLVLEFSDSNYTLIKFINDETVLLEEKIHWDEFIQTNEKTDEVSNIAKSIKNLAERIISN